MVITHWRQIQRLALFFADTGQYLIKDMYLSALTTIGGVATPGTLAGALTAIANLIAE